MPITIRAKIIPEASEIIAPMSPIILRKTMIAIQSAIQINKAHPIKVAIDARIVSIINIRSYI